MRIDFNRPPFVGKETEYIRQAVESNRMICGDGPFTKKCSAWMKEKFHTREALLTTSCTHALEMAAYLARIQPGDEVIMPSYTFVSTADAFVLRGATCVFVDIHPETMNIDETKIEDAITEKTKAIVPVHYAGVSCAMDEIMAIAEKHHLKVIEDAAQGVNAWYKGRALGTIGDFGCYSFHETKNYSMGEGGALFFQNEEYLEKAEILREKGTNRSKFFRGQIDKYTWVDYGSSYLPSDMNAAYLWAQLEEAEKINQKRLSIWNFYHEELKPLADRGLIEQPFIPEYASHNAHMYYIKVKNLETRTKLLEELKQQGILSVFHYVPLHSSEAGRKFGRFHGEDIYTTRESERLMRLPMYYSLSLEEAAEVVKALYRFFLKSE
ncbi:MAG: dTDP-4-amino-4,6-dideoxygalactose transaminase [Eubacterium sp.]|nr:dTDP-4-amino-4,6-dideoxygalactose transaminase [Eubacterium sp.]